MQLTESSGPEPALPCPTGLPQEPNRSLSALNPEAVCSESSRQPRSADAGSGANRLAFARHSHRASARAAGSWVRPLRQQPLSTRKPPSASQRLSSVFRRMMLVGYQWEAAVRGGSGVVSRATANPGAMLADSQQHTGTIRFAMLRGSSGINSPILNSATA